MRQPRSSAPERGAENLLVNCAGVKPGDRVLIATEPAEHGYFDAAAARHVAAAADRLGLQVEMMDVGFQPETPEIDAELLARVNAADVVLFFARLGDQLRFSDLPQDKIFVVSFALTEELLGSGFGTAHHGAFLEIKAAVNRALADADHVRMTCPAGTDVSGRPDMNLGEGGDTSVRRFPMSVFTPVPGRGFTGRVALQFLTGTGSRYYASYNVEFDDTIHAVMADGRLTGFEGSARDVARADAQYDRVAGLFGIDRNAVHSWHAGIHPGCGYPWDIRENFERWGGAAFGNPRILHFHTCGAYAPGEISWNVFDPTIEVDGVACWQDGVFHLDLLPGGRAILDRYACAAAVFAAPDPAIGLMPPWMTGAATGWKNRAL